MQVQPGCEKGTVTGVQVQPGCEKGTVTGVQVQPGCEKGMSLCSQSVRRGMSQGCMSRDCHRGAGAARV